MISIPIARSINHDDSIGLAHLNCRNLVEKWPFLDPKWTPVNWTLVFRALVSAPAPKAGVQLFAE